MWGRGGHQDLITAVKSAKRVWVKVLPGVLFKFWGKQQNTVGGGEKRTKVQGLQLLVKIFKVV